VHINFANPIEQLLDLAFHRWVRQNNIIVPHFSVRYRQGLKGQCREIEVEMRL
jgi:hypothetical protein